MGAGASSSAAPPFEGDWERAPRVRAKGANQLVELEWLFGSAFSKGVHRVGLTHSQLSGLRVIRLDGEEVKRYTLLLGNASNDPVHLNGHACKLMIQCSAKAASWEYAFVVDGRAIQLPPPGGTNEHEAFVTELDQKMNALTAAGGGGRRKFDPETGMWSEAGGETILSSPSKVGGKAAASGAFKAPAEQAFASHTSVPNPGGVQSSPYSQPVGVLADPPPR